LKDLNHIKYFYFIGIGGIGMSALARYFKAKDSYVAGYDRTSTGLTKTLETEGVDVNYKDDVSAIPETILNNQENTLII